MKKIPEIIVAVDCEGGFGKDGKLPWSLPEELKHFKELTTGHVCVMGRNTYNDILALQIKRAKAAGKANLPIVEVLPGRECYVVSSTPSLTTPGATKVKDLKQVMDKMRTDKRNLFVIGGRRMFIEALSWNPLIHMTIIKGDRYNCDVFFPVDVLNKKYKIVSGKETDKAYYVQYQRK